MSNIHGLHSFRRRESEHEEEEGNDGNSRYVGGVDSRGGGSGLAVQPNPENGAGASDAIFNLANPSGGGAGGGGEIRRTITMYRSGFTVDDGPYRRLDDPANAEFLTSLARGRTPRELAQEAEQEGGEVLVGLVDRRSEEYDPERHGTRGGGGERGERTAFQSFSGEGQSLGASSSTASNGVIDPSDNSTAPPQLDASRPSTSIAIRLLNGKRLVVKVNLDSSVASLGQHINAAGSAMAGESPYVLTAGFPPRPIGDLEQTIEAAGLKGAQVVQKKA